MACSVRQTGLILHAVDHKEISELNPNACLEQSQSLFQEDHSPLPMLPNVTDYCAAASIAQLKELLVTSGFYYLHE